MTKAYGYTSLNSEHFLNYGPMDLDVLSMISEDPDAFDPKGLVPRDEDGYWDLEFDIRLDLKRHAFCDVQKRRIVHDQMRVWDVTRLMLQTLVWPSTFAHAAHLVKNAADIPIAHSRIQGARVLIDAFFDAAEEFGLRKALSLPLNPRISDFSTSERHLENTAEAIVIGHEIGHYLVRSERRECASRDDLEMQCDAAGLELSLLFDETEYFWTVEGGWDGPEPVEHSAIGGVWGMFEHFVTAVFWGDALLLRAFRCTKGESEDPFPLARRRTEAMIKKFRSTETGHRDLPFSNLSLAPLEEAFKAIDALVTTTIDPDDDWFSVRVTRERFALAGEHYELESHWKKRLNALGLETSIGGVIIPRAEDHPGMDRWSRVLDDNTMSPPEPYRYEGPQNPGKDRKHRYLGRE